jgi:hypothetical protein
MVLFDTVAVVAIAAAVVVPAISATVLLPVLLALLLIIRYLHDLLVFLVYKMAAYIYDWNGGNGI